MKSARILVISNEVPYPANSGGRVDVWRHLNILRKLGGELALLTWYDAPRDGTPSVESLRALDSVCSKVHLIPITRSKMELLQRLFQLGRLPSHAASRWVTASLPELSKLLIDFRPTLVLLHGLYGAAVASWASRQASVPLIYRSHNIEHRYMRGQLSKAKSLVSRAGLLANLIGLESFERKIIYDATSVLDISLDDRDYWIEQGYSHIQWLPTAVTDDFADGIVKGGRPDWDLMYFGNLNTPNNVDAIQWLVEKVLSRLTNELRVAVAGSKPSARLMQIAARDNRITVIPNPPELSRLIGSARILVNPVRTGSGVNLKSVEMLFTDAKLISTTTGVQGLPEQARRCFDICDEADQFAARISSALAADVGVDDLTSRGKAREFFGSQSVARAFERLT